ncbi:MAG: fucose isomerase, partial [Spirochaetes bacterium GWF1_41_5]
RDCFPVALSASRKNKVVEECRKLNLPVCGLEIIIENEKDMLKALDEAKNKNVNALVIYLGNFGPEGPLSMLARYFHGPVMVCAASEESGNNLIDGRGDAYCGMLNASYNFNLRNLHPYIPEYPAGTSSEIAVKIADFIPVARILLGLKKLKIFSFGPRPQDFFACNAPIKALYDLGVEIMENSELDLYDAYKCAGNAAEIKIISASMAKELGSGNNYPDLLEKLAQYETGLIRFMEKNLGASEYGIFANKCWPSFEKYFGFVPCYVNARLAEQGIPVSCEVDIYGALSEYIITLATLNPSTILDINNTVPYDLQKEAGINDYENNDLFMGFHCGNTCISCMKNYAMKYQLIMHRLMEPGIDPDITRGTIEGRIKPGKTTLFRLQSGADTILRSYIVQGEILDADPRSFGAIGIFAVREMGRFYRHVLIEKNFPHHSAVGFGHAGKTLFAVMKILGVSDIAFNQPKGMLYPGENPFQNMAC